MAEEAGVYRGPKCVLQAEKCLNLCRFISLLIFALIPWAKNVIILHCWISLATKTMTSQSALLSVLWYHLRNDLHILDRRLDFGHAASLILVIDVVLSPKGQPLSSIWFKLQFSMLSVCANGKNAKLINGLNKSYASHWIDHIISNTGQISVTLRRRRRSAL